VISEQNFFLNLAIRLRLNEKTTRFQIKEIHQKIISGEKSLNDYSDELQRLYNYYLEFLKINKKID